MSTYVQFVAIVRVVPVAPPAALNGASFTFALPLAMESQSGSPPDVESFTSPLDASTKPEEVELGGAEADPARGHIHSAQQTRALSGLDALADQTARRHPGSGGV